jgi:hypothetical protein
MNEILNLKDKLLSKRSEQSPLTDLIYLARELNCLGEIIGKEYIIYDKNGNTLYTIKQKTLTISQIKLLMAELKTIIKIENKSNKTRGTSKR